MVINYAFKVTLFTPTYSFADGCRYAKKAFRSNDIDICQRYVKKAYKEFDWEDLDDATYYARKAYRRW